MTNDEQALLQAAASGDAGALSTLLGQYGPQIELHNIRPFNDEDRTNGFDPAQLIEASRSKRSADMRSAPAGTCSRMSCANALAP